KSSIGVAGPRYRYRYLLMFDSSRRCGHRVSPASDTPSACPTHPTNGAHKNRQPGERASSEPASEERTELTADIDRGRPSQAPPEVSEGIHMGPSGIWR